MLLGVQLKKKFDSSLYQIYDIAILIIRTNRTFELLHGRMSEFSPLFVELGGYIDF